MKQRWRRRFGPKRGGRPVTKPIRLYLQRIPIKAFTDLPEQERYALLLLGHIHDELSWLQRMAYAASRRTGHASDLEASADMMQATFLARLMLGKLWEFRVVLNNEASPLATFIAQNWRPDDPGAGDQRVQEILAAYESQAWLRVARNKHFLHYPTFGDVEETIRDPNIVWDVQIAHGAQSSNTFYPASDVLANYAWFRRVNEQEPMRGLGDALGVLTKVARLTMDTREQSIGYFVDRKLVSLSDNEVVTIRAPSIHDFRLGYFVSTGSG